MTNIKQFKYLINGVIEALSERIRLSGLSLSEAIEEDGDPDLLIMLTELETSIYIVESITNINLEDINQFLLSEIDVTYEDIKDLQENLYYLI